MLEHIQTLEGHTDRVWTLSWNPKGTILATSGADKSIRLWAKDNGNLWACVAILTGSHNKSIRRLSWSPCGNYLASASFDSTVCIWRRQPIDGSWSTIVNLEGHDSEVKSVAWSCDGKYLASCGRDKTIWIWERANDHDDDTDFEGTDSAENWDCSDVKNDHTMDVKHIVWHPTCPILASCSYDDTVKLFHKEGDDWSLFETLNVHSSTVWSMDFSASGEYMVSCSDDKTVRVWKNHSHSKLPQVEPGSWKCISVIQGYHNRSIYDVSWSKQDELIASASGDNSIAIYSKSDPSDTSDGCDMFTCCDKQSQAHHCDVNSVEWNPVTQSLLASGGDDRKVKLWLFKPDDRGRKPSTVINELVQRLSQHSTNTEICSTPHMNQEPNATKIDIMVDSYKRLHESVIDLQKLKLEHNPDIEKANLEKFLDLRFTNLLMPAIDISGINYDQDGSVKSIDVELVDNSGASAHRFQIVLTESKFTLKLPRRSIKINVVGGDLFLIEKTGDLYKVNETGDCQFLLGHLFMLSDVQFVTKDDGSQILFVLSVDRDEKIRISNYPNTFNIEKFCFGHRSFIKRLLVIDETQFVSVDQHGDICIWDLDSLQDRKSIKPLSPKEMLNLGGNSRKKICIR